MSSTVRNMIDGAREAATRQAEHLLALRDGHANVDDPNGLRDMFVSEELSQDDLLEPGGFEFTAESPLTTPRTSHHGATARVAGPPAVPPQAQLAPDFFPHPDGVLLGYLGHMHMLLQQGQPFSPPPPQAPMPGPAQQYPHPQQQLPPPPPQMHQYAQQVPQQHQPQPQPRHQWLPQSSLQGLQLLQLQALPAPQQHQFHHHRYHQQQHHHQHHHRQQHHQQQHHQHQYQHPGAVVPPPEGCPSDEWLQETADLLSSSIDSELHNSGLRRLGDMMWGLSMHLDAKGYELPTAFPPAPGGILLPLGPTSYLLVTSGKATNSRQNSGVELLCVSSLIGFGAGQGSCRSRHATGCL